MNGPLVSVIIPCYNTGRFLPEALQSLFAQDYAPLDITVVDDGSADNSADVAASFPQVRVIRQANAGVSAARNNGIKATTGEFIIFFDADDRMLPGAIETSIREMLARPTCAMVYGFSRPIDQQGRPLPPEFRRQDHASFATLLAGDSLVPPGAAVFRRSAIERVGGFNPALALCEDHEFYLRLAREFPIHCHNQLVVEWRQHDHNASRASPTRTLEAILWTINSQRDWIHGKPELLRAAREGRRRWREVFGPWLAFEMMNNLKRRRFARAGRAFAATVRHYPRSFLLYARSRVRADKSQHAA